MYRLTSKKLFRIDLCSFQLWHWVLRSLGHFIIAISSLMSWNLLLAQEETPSYAIEPADEGYDEIEQTSTYSGDPHEDPQESIEEDPQEVIEEAPSLPPISHSSEAPQLSSQIEKSSSPDLLQPSPPVQDDPMTPITLVVVPETPPSHSKYMPLLTLREIEDLAVQEIEILLDQSRTKPRPNIDLAVQDISETKWIDSPLPSVYLLTFEVQTESAPLLEKEARHRIARALSLRGFKFHRLSPFLTPPFKAPQTCSARENLGALFNFSSFYTSRFTSSSWESSITQHFTALNTETQDFRPQVILATPLKNTLRNSQEFSDILLSEASQLGSSFFKNLSLTAHSLTDQSLSSFLLQVDAVKRLTFFANYQRLHVIGFFLILSASVFITIFFHRVAKRKFYDFQPQNNIPETHELAEFQTEQNNFQLQNEPAPSFLGLKPSSFYKIPALRKTKSLPSDSNPKSMAALSSKDAFGDFEIRMRKEPVSILLNFRN